MAALLIRLDKIPQISFIVAFAAPIISILNRNLNFDPSLRLQLWVGLGLGIGLPSSWNQSCFYNPLLGLDST